MKFPIDADIYFNHKSSNFATLNIFHEMMTLQLTKVVHTLPYYIFVEKKQAQKQFCSFKPPKKIQGLEQEDEDFHRIVQYNRS